MARRGRRSSRFVLRRGMVWVFTALFVILIYLAFFSIKPPAHGEEHVDNRQIDTELTRRKHDLSNTILTLINATNVWNHNELGHDTYKKPKSKFRKQHFPCPIDFRESVEIIMEPRDYMNFTQFSLDYVTVEKKMYLSGIEPRFGGHQTFEERENSFYVKDQKLHCGFVKGPEGYPSTGFDLSEKDKEYMAKCIVVVSSCIFGSSDFLRRPTKNKKDKLLMRVDLSVYGKLLL